MATFTTRFLGCKVSFADEQAIREQLLAEGHAEAGEASEIAVINTCCVTGEAVAKSRQAAARAARRHARVYVTGCAANLPGPAFAGLPDNVRVLARRSEDVAAAVAGDVGAIGCVQSDHRLQRVRAFVKIQDGCSFSCAFCVIPLVRGGTRSRAASAVLTEIQRRVRQGHPEVVLTGVNLGCFRDREAGLTLAGLIRRAGAIEGLERLRLSSIEINHVTPDLVAALRETASAAPHLHVPLQSGDDDVLAAMGRRYSSAQYRARLEGLADFNLTTDVIVGFPGEDEEAFLRPRASSRSSVSPRSTCSRTPLGRERAPRPMTRSRARQEGAKRAPAAGVGRGVPPALACADRERRRRRRRPARARLCGRLHAVARGRPRRCRRAGPRGRSHAGGGDSRCLR